MTSHDQLADRPASISLSANQQWQQLVDEMQASWSTNEPEQTKKIFQKLYEISVSLLLSIARLKAPTDEMVEDIVAEVYLEFYEMLEARKPIHNAKPLLCQMVQRRCIDAYRRHRKLMNFTTQGDETLWSSLRELPDVLTDTPEEIVVSLDTARSVSNLILDALPIEARRVLIMRYVQELSVAETAKRMNMTEDQVKKRTRRAKDLAYSVAQERGLLHDLT